MKRVLVSLMILSMLSCSAVKLYPSKVNKGKENMGVSPSIYSDSIVQMKVEKLDSSSAVKVDVIEDTRDVKNYKNIIPKEFWGKTYHVPPFENTFNIALVLPFNLHVPAFEKNALGDLMMDYYEGLLTSVKELEKNGFKAKIKIYDSGDDSMRMVRLFSGSAMNKYDLVIGPIRDKGLKTAYEFSQRTGIPVVSPLQYYGKVADTSLNSPFINMFAHDTSRAYSLGQEVARKYKNYKVVLMSNTEPNAEEYFLRRNFRLGYANFSKKYAATIKNTKDVLSEFGTKDSLIIYYPTKVRSQAISMMHNVSKLKNVKVLGLSDWMRFKKIDYKKWDNTFIYSDQFFIDRHKEEIVDFRRTYRDMYSGEPSRFVFIGYDQMTFLGSAMMALGPNFYQYLSNSDFDMLCSRIQLKNNKGFYENSGIKIVEYNELYLKEKE